MFGRLKICYYPRYDISVGSSRCRCYFIVDQLREEGHEVYLQSAPFEADIVVFQKTYEKWYCELAKEVKAKGIPIVFDMDDDYQCKDMLELSDAFVCDSQGLVDFCQKQTTKKLNGRVILNPVDYIKEPLPKRIHTKKDNLEIVYFAGAANFKAFKNCRSALEKLRKEGYNFNLTILGGNSWEQIMQYAPDIFKGFTISYEPWIYETFSQRLQEFDFAILPQAWDWKGPAKQTESVSHNIPAVCEKIEPNEKLYRDAGLMEYLAGTEDEWYSAIKKLFDPAERNRFLDKVLPIVWRDRSKKKITQEWIKLFEELK